MNRSNFRSLIRGLFISGIVLTLTVQAALADNPRDGVLDPVALSRAGLMRVWNSQAEIGAADSVKHAILHVSNTRASVFFEIYVGNELRKSFATLDRDALGNRLGYERAKELADLEREITEQEVAGALADAKLSQAEFAELTLGTSPEAIQMRQALLEKNQKKVEVRKYVEPRMTLYVLSSRNYLQAFDAETGNLRWSAQVGPPSSAGFGIAANDAMVSVVNGLRIYCFEANQGRELWNRRCKGAPNAPPAMSHSHIFVPLMDGRVEAFNIETDGIQSDFYVSHGAVSAAPLVSGRTVSWPTNVGHYNVAYFDQIGSIKYRIHANASIVCTPARLGRVLFVVGMDGYVYAVDEVLGTIYWEYSTGSSIRESPLAVGDNVYVTTDNEELYKIDSKTGLLSAGWPKTVSGIRRLLGASEPYIYGEDSASNLVVIRAENGGIEYSIPIGRGTNLLNSQTDRIYLITSTGSIQCLRQNSRPHPVFHVPVSEAIATMESSGTVPQQTWRTRKAQKLDETIRNPFETKEELSQDPFSASEPVYDNPFMEKSAGEVNPFELDTDGAPPAEPAAKSNQPPGDAKPADAPQPKPSDDPFGGG